MIVLVPFAVLASVFGIVHGVFDTPIRGSVALFYGVSVIYVVAWPVWDSPSPWWPAPSHGR